MSRDYPTAPDWPPSTNPRRSRYPSDLKDGQWAMIAPHIARTTDVGRPSRYDLRDVVDAINYRWQTGCVWRMLPHDFPPWTTVYSHFRDWQRRGLLSRLREILLRPARESLPTREAIAKTTGSGNRAPERELPAETRDAPPSDRDPLSGRPVAA